MGTGGSYLVFTGETMILVSSGGCVLETGAGRKMGCEEKGGVKDEDARDLGPNTRVLTVKKQIWREEIQDPFWTQGM